MGQWNCAALPPHATYIQLYVRKVLEGMLAYASSLPNSMVFSVPADVW